MTPRGEGTLVLFPGALGDAVCLEPAVAHLARSSGPVTLYARGGAAEAAALYPSRPCVCSLDAVEVARLFAAADDPRTGEWLGRFARIVSFTGAGVPAVVARLEATGRATVARFPRPPLSAHAADLFLRAVGAEPRTARSLPRLMLPEAPQPATGRPRLVLLPGSGGRAKRAPVALHAALAERWRASAGEVTVVLGPAEAGEDAAWRALGPVARPESIASLARILSPAAAFVGSDSGPSHVAAALGVPGVVLFASTIPEAFGPRGACIASVPLAADGVAAAVESAWRVLRCRLP